MERRVARIDAGPIQRAAVWYADGIMDMGIITFMGTTLGGSVAVFALVFGIIAITEGDLVMGLTLIGFAISTVVGMPGMYYYGDSKGIVNPNYYWDGPKTASLEATNIYHKLNKDNKTVAKQTVLRIYELDKVGVDCSDRIKALNDLHNEQVALEKQTVMGVDTDLDNVVEYTKLLSHQRKIIKELQ